jgi:ABC-type uncharacterized transport system substrate-binding protein
MFKKTSHLVFFLFAFAVIGLISTESYAAKIKVLVVMSYHESMPWVQEIKEGIYSEAGKFCALNYFFMDTKRNIQGGPQKAKEAFALYQEFRPDGVIAADDNAQSMFVVPYLKDKVKTPVIFCGVNSEPEKYGYPASNVTGILERAHFIESIKLVQQLVPSVRVVGSLLNNNPTGREISRQIQQDSNVSSAEKVVIKFAKTLEEAKAMTEELRNQCDALNLVGLEGLLDIDGKPITEREIIPILAKIFGKPTFSPDIFNIKLGLLCTVSKTGQDQGESAARMLLKAMQGTHVDQIPITRNKYGKRVINVSVMKQLGIKPKPIILQGAELVRTEE